MQAADRVHPDVLRLSENTFGPGPTGAALDLTIHE